MPPEQRLRVVLGITQIAIAVMVLIIMLVDGSRWFGWLIVASSLLSGLTQFSARRQTARLDNSRGAVS